MMFNDKIVIFLNIKHKFRINKDTIKNISAVFVTCL